MPPRRSTARRDTILAVAGRLLDSQPGASVDVIAGAAGVSRATFYRHFDSRAELLAALDIQPDPDAHQRILAAAVELVGRDGLRGMSMDELATSAGVSRASVYRLFPSNA
jgi:AcrR family transcriptional regulator